jgi:VWFA-related protein
VTARVSVYLPRPQYTLRTETRLVEVTAVVRDRRGRAVGGLQKSDFEVRDRGNRRAITSFTTHTFTPAALEPRRGMSISPVPVVRPRFVGLLFDDLNSQFAEFRYAQLAGVRFVKENLAAGDRVAIFTTNSAQVLPFTSDVSRLVSVIEKLRMQRRIVDSGSCPQMTPFDAYLIYNGLDASAVETKANEARRCLSMPPQGQPGRFSVSQARLSTDPIVRMVLAQATAIWLQARDISLRTLDSIRYIVDYMAAMPGSRMLLLSSGGFLASTLEREQEVLVARALRGEVVINSLDAKGLYTTSDFDMPRGGDAASITRLQQLGSRPKEQTNDALVYLATSTGGLFYHNSNDLDRGFRELGALPEVTYLLGFTPDSVPDGKYHKLSVRLTSARGYSLQARPGYYAMQADTPLSSPERRIDREALLRSSFQEVPVSLAVLPRDPESSGTGLTALLHIDLKQLPFLDQSGARTQKLAFIAALLDEEGTFVAGREGSIDFALKEDTFQKSASEGLNVRAEIEAPAGTYRLRFVVEESVKGGITASNQSVTVR